MLVSSPTRNRRRSAFTLLEVLVVVAILIVLASVATISVFKFYEDSKKDKAALDMQALETAYTSAVLKSGDEIGPQNFQIQMLVPYMTQGSTSVIDPWGNPYQFRFQPGETGEDRIQFFTQPPSGEMIVWPRR